MSKTGQPTEKDLDPVPQAREPPATVTTEVTATATDNHLVEVRSEDGSVAGILFIDEDAGQAATADVIQSLQDEAIPIAARRES